MMDRIFIYIIINENYMTLAQNEKHQRLFGLDI